MLKKIANFLFSKKEEENKENKEKKTKKSGRFSFKVTKNREIYGTIYEIPARDSEEALELLKDKIVKEFFNRYNIVQLIEEEEVKINLKP